MLLVGAVLIIIRSFDQANLSLGNPGNLLILAGAVGIGTGYVFAKRSNNSGDALQITTLRLFIGVIAGLLFLSGIVLIAAGGPAVASGVWLLIVGGTGIVAIALERSRYR